MEKFSFGENKIMIEQLIAGFFLCASMSTWWPEQRIPSDIQERIETCMEIVEKTPAYNNDPALALTYAYQESKFNALAVSSAGAIGPLQYMPSAWRCERVNGRCDNVLTGLRIMRHYIDNSLMVSNGNPHRTSVLPSIEAQACMGTGTQYALHNAMTSYICRSCEPGESRWSRSRMRMFDRFLEAEVKVTSINQDDYQFMLYVANNINFNEIENYEDSSYKLGTIVRNIFETYYNYNRMVESIKIL